MPIGSILDVINAKKVRLYLGAVGSGNDYVDLQEITMPLNRDETREAVEKGSVYFYGQHDNSFDATMLLTGGDIGAFLDRNQLVDGHLVELSYDIQLVAKDNTTVVIRVTAVAPEQEIEKLVQGGVKIRQTFRITEDVDSGNIV